MRSWLGIAAVLWAQGIFAQDQKLSRDSLDTTLPAEILQAVRAASITSIYPVNNAEHFDGQILKVDQIVFGANATLTLRAVGKPWIVLAAKRWKFADPRKWTRIDILRRVGDAGSEGSTGSRGANRPGGNGQDGQPG